MELISFGCITPGNVSHVHRCVVRVVHYPMTWLGPYRILYHGILQCRSHTMQGSAICCHEYFVVITDINNGVMTTPSATNGQDYVTGLPVTSQWFGML